jgi:hypothetical protein
MFYSPSIYAHVISGVVLFVGAIYLALYSSKILSRNPYQLLVLILLISISAGVHGISHIALETVYNYNPLSLFNRKQSEAYHPLDCPYRRSGNCPHRRSGNCPFFKDNSI